MIRPDCRGTSHKKIGNHWLLDKITSHFVLIGVPNNSFTIADKYLLIISLPGPCAQHSMSACAPDGSHAGSREQTPCQWRMSCLLHILSVSQKLTARMRAVENCHYCQDQVLRLSTEEMRTLRVPDVQMYRWSRQRGITCSYKGSKARGALTH